VERPSDGPPVTVMIARRVTEGLEAEFEQWAAGLTRTASAFPGFLGAGLLRPSGPQEPWHVVYRFDSRASLDAWERSSDRSGQLAAGEHLVEETTVRRVSGLETWFASPGLMSSAPPRWKMFLVSGSCIYLLQLVLYALLGSTVLGWPMPLRVLVVASLVTALMTWVVMPFLARRLSSWLYPRPDPEPAVRE
jgi:antibiotic biosynthesis monooxygenase (ABM) superfamily enzyme